MKKTHIIALSVSAIVIIILSIVLGYKSVNENNNYSSPEDKTNATPDAQQTIADSTMTEPDEKYKIILKDSYLELYEDEMLVRKTRISPDVFPRADVKALTQGIHYSTIEKALTDWESLCN